MFDVLWCIADTNYFGYARPTYASGLSWWYSINFSEKEYEVEYTLDNALL